MQFNAYSGLDVHKETIVIAIAEAGSCSSDSVMS